MNQSERRLFLLHSLLKEQNEYKDIAVPDGADQQCQLLRALMNVRMPVSEKKLKPGNRKKYYIN